MQKLGRNRLEMERKKRQKMAATEKDISNLPWEIIYTILSKVPVKSLLRFRCVCKTWLALISEPQFIKSHLNEAIKLDRQRVICSSSSNKSKCFYSVDCERFGKSKEELCFPIKKYRKASVLASCNGVVLLGFASDTKFVLWNPSTREHNRLFLCPYSQHYHFHFHFWGICYDSSIDDYKVVCILKNKSDYKYFAVYTCKTNSWTETRELGKFREFGSYEYRGKTVVTVSGAPHWVMALQRGHKLEHLGHMPKDYTSKASQTSSSNYHHHYDEAVPTYQHNSDATYAIIYFDVVEEKFKKVPPPNWICEGNIFDLITIRGCLGIYLTTSDNQHTDVWVMKEYGEWNSWTKLISIPHPAVFGKLHSTIIMPVSFTKNGEVVVLEDHCKLLRYNLKKNQFRNMTIPTRIHFPGVYCVDSLVLSGCDNLTKRQQKKHKENGKMKALY